MGAGVHGEDQWRTGEEEAPSSHIFCAPATTRSPHTHGALDILLYYPDIFSYFFCNWCRAERQSEVRHLTSVNHLTSATLQTLNSSKLCFERKEQKLMIVSNILSCRIQQGELRVWDDGVELSVHKLHKTNILITRWHLAKIFLVAFIKPKSILTFNQIIIYNMISISWGLKIDNAADGVSVYYL